MKSSIRIRFEPAQRFGRPSVGRPSRYFLWTVLKMCFVLTTILPFGALGGEKPIISFNENSSQYGEYFCYRSKLAERSEVHLVRCGVGKTEAVFSKQTSSNAHAPICLRDGLVVTEIGGKVSKYDLQGNLKFSSELPDFDGASKFGSRLNNRLIVIDRTWYRRIGSPASHELLVVDVSGERPVIRTRIETEQVLRVTRIGDEVFAINSEKSWALQMPQEIKEDLDRP